MTNNHLWGTDYRASPKTPSMPLRSRHNPHHNTQTHVNLGAGKVALGLNEPDLSIGATNDCKHSWCHFFLTQRLLGCNSKLVSRLWWHWWWLLYIAVWQEKIEFWLKSVKRTIGEEVTKQSKGKPSDVHVDPGGCLVWSCHYLFQYIFMCLCLCMLARIASVM